MDSKTFLETVWPSTGKYCIATSIGTLRGYDHFIFDSMAAALAKVDQLKATKNVFFATHTLIEDRVWTENLRVDKATGKKTVGGYQYRIQSNMRSSRIFFFDLDVEVGNPKKYDTQKDAADALKQFVTRTKLPRPLVTSSGGGLHVYWVLDQEIPSATTWLTQAGDLRNLAAFHGLRFDPQRTTDRASVLRVVGTSNLKTSTARPVVAYSQPEVVTPQQWTDRLYAAMDDDGVSRAKAHAPRAADDGLGSNLDGKIYDLPPPTLKAVMTVCPQVRRITLESDKSPEPEWYNGTVGVVKFVENGPALVHAISKRYGNYNAADTESKIVQWPGGATSCQKLDNVCNNDICKQCPLFKQKSNPVTLARNAEKAEPPTMIQEVGDEQIEITIPNPPLPYKRGRLGGIQMLMEKDGREFTVPVLKHDLYPLARQKNRGAQTETQVWRCHLPHDEVHEFSIPAKSFVDNKALQGILADQGVYTDDMPKLRGYMSAYIQELQKQEKPVEQVSHLGWINEYTEFVLSDKILTKDGSKPVSLAPIVQSAGDFLSKRGSLSEQIKLLKFFDHPQYVDRQFFILAALASPLFHCTGEAGIVVNACGKPGASKSTSLDTGAAFWGKPADYVMDGTKGGSTQNARDARRGILCNLPFCLDELTGIEPDEARAMAMGSTQTQPIKKRLHQDGTPRTSEKYERSSIQMITANVSMHGLMATGNRAGTAGAMRVFEINFDIPTVHKTWEHKHYLREVKKNYGHIGPAFMALVVKHADQVEQLVNQEFIRLMKAGSMENGERFWFALGAAVIATAKIAKKWGLSPFDPAAIESWFLHNQIPGLRGVVVADEAANEPATVLGDYIESIGGNMLITRKSGGNLEEFEVIESRASLKGHIDLDKGVGWFVKNEFRSYCDRRGLFAQQILKQLLLSGVVASLERKLTIGAGTKYAKGQTMCFTVDMNHPAISDKTPKPIKKGLTVIQGGKAL